jgi:redox-sensitive bicupin YhaK (pirin superfamily)
MKIQRFERIPAWPLTKGIGFKAMELILPGKAGRNVASRLESIYGGGMDCPNIFVNSHQEMQKTSPFLMLVHHNHSFRVNDPLRYIEKSLIPEGFPSHPHRGMLTVTICLAGGMVHRDSLGIKQVFGAGDEKYLGKHTQALNFGAGVVHELMWDNTISPRRRRIGSPHSSISQEIYQIWVDLPQEERMSNISVDLLGGQEETPTVIEKNVGSGEFESSTLVIAGSHKHHKSKMVQKSDFTILQVTLEPGKKWIHSSPTLHDSTILYMRKGSATIEGRQIPLHCTAFCSCDGQDTVVVAGTKGADFLFLSGEPLDQNVVARGSMVGETNRNIAQAAQDAKGYKMGKPWDEGLSDAQWKHHAERYPCEYEMD